MADQIAGALLAAALVLLPACGGGGGGGGSVTVANQPDPPASPQPPVDPAPDPPPTTPDPPTTPPPRDLFDAFACGSGGASVTGDAAPGSFTLFESGPARPLALTTDGTHVLVTNTPANCLESYRIEGDALVFEDAVMVGMEPVAVALRNDSEAWVVNHLSDSISIVDLNPPMRVLRTLQVGDEPRDILFAGPDRQRAFITAAYRGQNHPRFQVDDLTQPGLGRADVWVYDAGQLNDSLTGGPLAIVNLFADAPRALAASSDGSIVYAAAFHSGNASTVLSADVVVGGKPLPRANHGGTRAPDTGLIVRKADNRWLDEAGADWSARMRLDLPDLDVFAIDAMAEAPAVSAQFSGVGSTLFNMAVNPVSDELYVSNLNALNHVRFEGPGETATTVRGHIAESRISVLSEGRLNAVHLNPHVDFEVPEGSRYPPAVRERSLSQPTALAVSPDGEQLYVAAFGSGKVAVLPTAQLRDGTYAPAADRQLAAPAGPLGLVLLADGQRAVIYGLFDHELALIDTASGNVLTQRSLFTPEPAAVREGRRFLYDANLTSANGTSACSSCHIFGDLDQLAWDLGNPDADLQRNPNPYVARSPITTFNFHPMKGPMTTQTLRGIADSGPMHWRGDRTGENRAMVNGELESIESAAFKEFNGAFVGLVGGEAVLAPEELQAFTDFALALTPPPNPVRRLDNSLTAAQARGRDVYFNVDDITGIGSCNHCHTLDPLNRHFGTSGLMTFEGTGIAENFKIPHFRNAYAKVGMFGTTGRLNRGGHSGAQIRGFGYLHDGSIATLLDFFASPTFNIPEPRREREADIVRFVMAADSNLAPIVGQQVTLAAGATGTVRERVALLEERAGVVDPLPECDLAARGMVDGLRTSALLAADGNYRDTNGRSLTPAELLAMAQVEGNSLTYTCLPPGSGSRIALDVP